MKSTKILYAVFLSILLCTTSSAYAQVALSPTPILQFINANGTPASGGELFTYQAGTTTKIATYIDSTGLTPNTNPIILNTLGEANVWIQPGTAYKYVLAPPGSSDPPTSPIWTVDNISLGSTTVSSTTVLQNTARSSVPSGIVLRVDFAPGNGAPPMWFTSETGTCTSNGLVNDGGSCVNATDGNSWVGKFNYGLADIREFGAIANNTTDATSAINAASTYSQSQQSCAFVPSVPTPFAVASSINVSTSIGSCITGTWGAGYSGFGTSKTACQLHFTSDTNGITDITGQSGFAIKHISICGNAAESLVATQTVGLSFGSVREGQVEDIYIQDFVWCVQATNAVSRSVINNIHCADQALYPNLVNGFPQGCVQSTATSNGAYAATIMDGWECREQAFGGSPARYSGDGSTTFFDISQPSGGMPLFAADGIEARVGANQQMPNGFNKDNAPQYACGPDYTLWDITFAGGSGSGGTQVYCSRKTITITPNSNIATVTAGGTSDIPSTSAPYNIAVIADHGLALDPRITGVNTGAGTFTMTGPATVVATETINVELVQIGIKGDGCGATICGTKMEVRFGTAPIAGTNNVALYWHDPTGWAAFDLENSSDYLEAKPVHVGGYRTLVRWVGQADGGIKFSPTYVEFTKQIADIEALSSGVEINVHNTINFQIPGAYAGDQAAAVPVNTQSQGGMVAPWYVSPIAGPTKISYTNVTYTYNGATSGGELHPGWPLLTWHLTLPGVQTTSAAGVSLGATNTMYCALDLRGAVSQVKGLAIDNPTFAGSGGQVMLAIYSNDPVTHRPGMLLTSTPAINLSAPGFPNAIVGTNTILSPGTYWDCMMATWTSTAPLFISYVSSTGSFGGVISPFNWWLGEVSLSTALQSSQAQGVTYTVGGLFAAGFPQSLVGLTSDAASTQIPVFWSEED